METNGYTTYTVREVAKILKVTEKTVITLVREGTIAGFKVGAVWRITKPSLENFMAKQEC
jgi:excisionase family DNA binding protein